LQESLPLLVDGGDRVALALADQIQADLLAGNVDLLVQAEPSPRYAQRLRSGRYAAALVGFQSVFADAGLDRRAWLHAIGGDAGVLAARLPLVAVDDCWAWRRPEQAAGVLRRLGVPQAVAAP
jgi:hypothetical protein